MDTIIALSTGQLPSGVAIIRLSGPKAFRFVETIIGFVPEYRVATLATFRGCDDEPIDQGLCLCFQGPNSFTGEDVAELHLHGSRAVVANIIKYACSFTDIRSAEAGEFARRAFTNGKMDLTAAEGLADLIEAETEAQRRVANFLASGGLRSVYNDWQDQLLNARAYVEADIDFADEDDVPGSVADKVWSDMAILRDEIAAHLDGYDRSERLRNGLRVCLLGRPNVGKSSLLNALVGSDRSIVSNEAGTTRDIVEVRLDLGGYLVLLSDTAGLRESSSAIETEGVKRAMSAAEEADLVLLLSDDDDWSYFKGFNINDAIKIRTKAEISSSAVSDAFPVSVVDAQLLQGFITMLTGIVSDRIGAEVSVLGIRQRYADHLNSTIKHLDGSLNQSIDIELRAESLRAAAFDLGRITGQVDTEDVLGRIFSSFCIGK